MYHKIRQIRSSDLRLQTIDCSGELNNNPPNVWHCEFTVHAEHVYFLMRKSRSPAYVVGCCISGHGFKFQQQPVCWWRENPLIYLTFFCACYVSENVNTFYKITGIKLFILKNWWHIKQFYKYSNRRWFTLCNRSNILVSVITVSHKSLILLKHYC